MRELLDKIRDLEKRVSRLEFLITPRSKLFISDKQKADIAELTKQGHTSRAIAKRVGCGNSSAFRYRNWSKDE